MVHGDGRENEGQDVAGSVIVDVLIEAETQHMCDRVGLARRETLGEGARVTEPGHNRW